MPPSGRAGILQAGAPSQSTSTLGACVRSALGVGTQAGAAPVENSVDVPQKIKNELEIPLPDIYIGYI